jgi:cyclopropane-fatty-acyl-phospholipid synthase
MLDVRLTYTCGYWKDADNLADAQEAKLDLVCRKLGLDDGYLSVR